MARMTCECGEYLNNQAAPNDVQLWVYTDREWDEMFNCDSIEPWMIPHPRYDVWRCPVCKNIYVYENGNDVPIMIYRLDKKS